MSDQMSFEDASEAVKKLSARPSNDELLKLYSLYKQGTEGDVSGKRPGMIDFKGRAKFDAWKKLEGLSGPDAQNQYVQYVSELMAKD